LDFAAAPDPTYPTLLASSGARHVVGVLRLGANVDAESDAHQNATATGDAFDDGVVLPATLVAGLSAAATATVTGGSGYLDAWIDFNHDGDFDDPSEKIAVGTSGDDVLIIEPRPSNMTQIRAKNTGKLLGIFPGSAFQRILVFGLDGNDAIVVDSRITKPSELHGNGGNDTLIGGSGGDALY